MADTIRAVDYWYAEVPDKPGEGVRILAALKQDHVNMLAFSGFPVSKGKSQIDFVPEDGDAFRKTATRLGLELSDRKRAFLVQGEDRVGAVADHIERLKTEQISVVSSQGLSAGNGRWAMILWVKPSDYQRASKALGI
jgi:hypothetical protein